MEYVDELLAECNKTGSFVPTALIRAVGSFFSDMEAIMASFSPAAAAAQGDDDMEVDQQQQRTQADGISVDIESVTSV